MIRRTLALMLPLCPRICSDSTAYRPAYMLFVLYKCIETLRMHNINAFFFHTLLIINQSSINIVLV